MPPPLNSNLPDELEDDGTGRNGTRFNSVDEVVGQVLSVARDQNGCRFLQRKFDEGGESAIAPVLPEVLDNVVQLMTDPFGNYLVQKLLEKCSDEQRLEVLKRVAANNELVNVSLNTHGTRAVQKLIETLSSPEQVQIVIKALEPGVVSLIKDLNGNHVVQRCLQRLGPRDSQFVYDAAGAHCVEIATHRHGCCVLQRCVDFATGEQRDRLVEEIAKNGLVLSQDPFGNYVVQYILELGLPWASAEVMKRLLGHYSELAVQKFSSNVVEKCLKLGGSILDDTRAYVIKEIMLSPQLEWLIQDPYANYVVQSALTVSKGALHAQLVEHIRPHMTVLRSSPYGKRILARSSLFGKQAKSSA